MRRILILGTMGLAAYYMIYRVLYTFNPDQMAFSIIFYAAELHGFISLFLFLFDVWSPIHPKPPTAPEGFTVDVFIPTYNEDVSLLRRTVLGAKAIRYPHKTYVLDDGNRQEVRAMAEDLDVNYIARAEHNHAKAGNINHALLQTDGDFVAIFDADHVPQSGFLDRTIGFFRDPEMAFVQTPQFFYNLNAFEEFSGEEADEHWEQQSMFFHYLQPGKQRWNSAFFCGTCAVIRRKALEEVGGIATETITEDIHTSVLIHARGWKSTYLDEHLATGLAPTDVVSYFKQRLRWALGNMRVLFICNPLTKSGLTLAQRISYFSAMFCWTIGFQKIVYYLTPPLMLLTPLMPIDRFFTSLVWLYAANLALQLFTYKVLTGLRGRIFMDELFNMLNFWFLIRSFFRAMFGLGQRFEVTTKSGGATAIPVKVVWPQLVVLALCVSGLSWWILKIVYGLNLDMLSSSIAASWSVYIMCLAGLAVARALRKYDVRNDYRFRESVPIWYRGDRDEWRAACTVDFNTQGMRIIAYEPLPMDRDMAMRLMTEDGHIEASARILYQRPNEHPPGIYSYGAKFTSMSESDRDRLGLYAMAKTVPRMMCQLYQKASGPHDALRRFIHGRRRRPAWMGLPISMGAKPGEWLHGRIVDLKQRTATLLTAQPDRNEIQRDFILLSPCGVIEGRMRVQSVSEPDSEEICQWVVYLETMTPDNAERYERLLKQT